MKTIKVADATLTQLDWLVAKCEFGGADEWSDDYDFNLDVVTDMSAFDGDFNPTINWSIAGPIIEREKIELTNWGLNDVWRAKATDYSCRTDEVFAEAFDASPLIAAMRCFVASKLGDTVEVPEELP